MTLYLLPNLLGAVKDHREFLPLSVEQAVAQIDGLIAESEREGRRFLKRFSTKKRPHNMPIALLNKSVGQKELDFLLEPILAGESWGVISDAGLVCLADQGSDLVRRAYQCDIPIQTFVGPCSITLALMQSGLSGQRFTFYGYIARKPKEELRQGEKISKKERSTQIFIEAPHRNESTLRMCLDVLKDSTLLCVASQLTLPDQWIHTAPVEAWKEVSFRKISKYIAKKPTIFLFQSFI